MSTFISQFKSFTSLGRAVNKPIIASVLQSSHFNTAQVMEMDGNNILAGRNSQAFDGMSLFDKTGKQGGFLITKMQLMLSSIAGTLILLLSPILYYLVLTLIKVSYSFQRVH